MATSWRYEVELTTSDVGASQKVVLRNDNVHQQLRDLGTSDANLKKHVQLSFSNIYMGGSLAGLWLVHESLMQVVGLTEAFWHKDISGREGGFNYDV